MAVNLRRALPHQDTPFFRGLHIVVAVLVLAQIINSNMTETEALGQFSLTGMVTFLHIISSMAARTTSDIREEASGPTEIPEVCFDRALLKAESISVPRFR